MKIPDEIDCLCADSSLSHRRTFDCVRARMRIEGLTRESIVLDVCEMRAITTRNPIVGSADGRMGRAPLWASQ